MHEGVPKSPGEGQHSSKGVPQGPDPTPGLRPPSVEDALALLPAIRGPRLVEYFDCPGMHGGVRVSCGTFSVVLALLPSLTGGLT